MKKKAILGLSAATIAGLVAFACGAFENVRSSADAVIAGAVVHREVCEAYGAACTADPEACDARADAVCSVRCE